MTMNSEQLVMGQNFAAGENRREEKEINVVDLRPGDTFRFGGSVYVFVANDRKTKNLVLVRRVSGQVNANKADLSVSETVEKLDVSGGPVFLKPVLNKEFAERYLESFVF